MNLEREIASRLGKPETRRGICDESFGYYRETTICGRRVKVKWRDPTNPTGRFGGGWQYEVGIQVGPSTVIVNLGVFSVRIERRKR